MRPFPLLSLALVLAASPAFGQVSVNDQALDSLGHHLEAQQVAKLDDQPRHFQVARRIGQRPDEALVDLQAVDRQPVQMRQ